MELILFQKLLPLIFIALLFPFSSVHCAQMAVIKAQKAYIYADQEQTTIIGFIRQGKKVRVGETVRGIGGLLPIIVSGKIAYISLVDLYLQEDLKGMSDFKMIDNQGIMEAIEEINRRDNQLSIIYQQFKMGSAWETLEQKVNAENSNNTGHEFKIRYEKFRKDKIGYLIGLSLQRQAHKNISFLNYLIEIGIPLRIAESNRFSLSLPVALLIAPHARITALNTDYSGQGIGANASLELSMELVKNIPIKFGVGYQHILLQNFDRDSSFDPGNDLALGGYTYHGGIGYQF